MLVISNEVAVLSNQVLQVMVIVTDDCDSLTRICPQNLQTGCYSESESESESALFAKCVQTHEEFVVVF